MPYIKRDSQGNITELLDAPRSGDEERLPADNHEVVAFVNKGEDDAVLKELQNSDREIARVTEDLIYLLVNKQVILFTELPEPVQQKLLKRERLRSELSSNEVSFLDDEDTIWRCFLKTLYKKGTRLGLERSEHPVIAIQMYSRPLPALLLGV